MGHMISLHITASYAHIATDQITQVLRIIDKQAAKTIQHAYMIY